MRFVEQLKSMYNKCSDAAMIRYIVGSFDFMIRQKHYASIDKIYDTVDFDGMPVPVMFSLFAMTNAAKENCTRRTASMDRCKQHIRKFRDEQFVQEIFEGVE